MAAASRAEREGGGAAADDRHLPCCVPAGRRRPTQLRAYRDSRAPLPCFRL